MQGLFCARNFANPSFPNYFTCIFGDETGILLSVPERQNSNLRALKNDIEAYRSDASYYEKALAYVEENGVYTYGAYVYATPDTLLEMMEKGIICDITYQDHWIDFYPGLN